MSASHARSQGQNLALTVLCVSRPDCQNLALTVYTYIYIYIHIHIYICTCIYVYIYIKREHHEHLRFPKINCCDKYLLHFQQPNHQKEREFFIDNLLVWIYFVIVMIRWTGLAPLEFEFPFLGSLVSAFLVGCTHTSHTSQVSTPQAPQFHQNQLLRPLPPAYAAKKTPSDATVWSRVSTIL